VDVTVVGMGKVDGFLYATYPGSYVAPLGDADGQPVADWEELLNAVYTLLMKPQRRVSTASRLRSKLCSGLEDCGLVWASQK
jgi:hypothetical protein